MTQQNQNTKWLFLDLNSYFASVEQQDNPHLRNRPVAVIPTNTPHTCAIAASYEAKAYGIKTGTIIRDAKKICPELICVIARHDRYTHYHNLIISEVITHTPINKIWSLDELSSRLPPNKRNVESATALAHRIKNGIWNNVGEAISCSIGIAPNSLLAKLASNMQKPDGLTFLTKDNLQKKLFPLKLTDIPGIGPGMEQRLIRAGINNIEQLWHISPKHARKIWGSVQGERFWYALHGYDQGEPETTSSTMVGHSRVLDPTLRHPDKTRLIARRLLIKASSRLRRKHLMAKTLSLGLRTTNDTSIRWKKEIHLTTPAEDPFTFLSYLDILWNKAMHDIQHYHGIQNFKFKKVSTLLYNLKSPQDITGDLFIENSKEDKERKEKHTNLTAALDHLQDKYKSEIVTLGIPPKTLNGYVGTKIAFSRVPDIEEFWE